MLNPTQIINPPIVEGFIFVLLSIFAGYFQKKEVTNHVLNSNLKYVILFGLLYFSINFTRGKESPNEQLMETAYLFVLFLLFEQLSPQWMGIVLIGFFVILYLDNSIKYYSDYTASTPREHVVHEKTIQEWKQRKQYTTYLVLVLMISGVAYPHVSHYLK